MTDERKQRFREWLEGQYGTTVLNCDFIADKAAEIFSTPAELRDAGELADGQEGCELPTGSGEWKRAEGNHHIRVAMQYQDVGPPVLNFERVDEPSRGGCVDDLPKGGWRRVVPEDDHSKCFRRIDEQRDKVTHLLLKCDGLEKQLTAAREECRGLADDYAAFKALLNSRLDSMGIKDVQADDRTAQRMDFLREELTVSRAECERLKEQLCKTSGTE